MIYDLRALSINQKFLFKKLAAGFEMAANCGMDSEDLLCPVVFHDGQAFFLEKSGARAGSYFGGPLERTVAGIKHGPRKLHHIATLNGDCVEPLWHVAGGGTLPLLYGMCFDGCRLKYKYSSTKIDVLEMYPTNSDPEWPYPDYPAYLPYFPLRLARQVPCSLEEFASNSCQPLNVAPSNLVAVVPASPILGISLWGPIGDAEGTQIVFLCDVSKHTVQAYNQCS